LFDYILVILYNLSKFGGFELANKIKYILDIGSSSMRLISTINYAGKPKIVAEVAALYDGYMDGEFLSPDQLDETFAKLLQDMSNKMRKTISKVVVGVPNDFCVCVCKRISRKYSNFHKITEQDLCEMYESNMSFGDSENYVLINYSPMQYVLDDNCTTLEPVNNKTMSILLDASYILAKRSFIEMFTNKLQELGLKEIEFVSTSLGQAMNCEHKDNNKPIAVVDVGHITTSVSVYKGEGLALLSSFSIGGGHISSDLMQLLNLGFKDAEMVKRKVILTIESNKNENYEVCLKGKLVKAPINMTNQIVKSRIEMISKIIKNILSVNDVFNGLDIYLTGDGLSNFKGAKNILKEITGSNVYEYKIPFDNSDKKFQTSKLGLALLANVAI